MNYQDAIKKLERMMADIDEMRSPLIKKSESKLQYALEDASAQVYYALKAFERYDYKMIKKQQIEKTKQDATVAKRSKASDRGSDPKG